MSDIYKNSFLTIAAVSAENDQAGFLGSKLWHVPIALPPLLSFPSDVKIWQAMDYQGFSSIQEPLEARAWAFQERLVPQRILSFRSKQMRWECNSSTWTEAKNPPGNHTVRNVGSRELYYKTLRSEEHLPPKSSETITLVGSSEETTRVLESNHSQLYSWWRTNIINTYANLHITKEEDRLPALSAIANEVHLKIQDTYLAGLWKRNLLLGLLWLSSSCPDWPIPGYDLYSYYPEPGHLPNKYRAPSWSWASIETNALGYASDDSIMAGQDECTARILQAECQVSGISITGEVSGGFIRLSARWFLATLHIAAVTGMKTEHSIIYSFAGLPVYNVPRSEFFWPDVPLVKESTSSSEDNSFFEPSIQRSTFSPGHTRPPISGTVSCVMITTLDSGYVAFMILGRAPSRPGAFERLGIFKIHQLFLSEGWYDSLSVGEFFIV
jgi:hypothetical protein